MYLEINNSQGSKLEKDIPWILTCLEILSLSMYRPTLSWVPNNLKDSFPQLCNRGTQVKNSFAKIIH